MRAAHAHQHVAYIHTHAHARGHNLTRAHACAHTCAKTSTHSHTHTCARTHACIAHSRANAHKNARIFSRARACARTHTHTRARALTCRSSWPRRAPCSVSAAARDPAFRTSRSDTWRREWASRQSNTRTHAYTRGRKNCMIPPSKPTTGASTCISHALAHTNLKKKIACFFVRLA